jgi:N-acetylmuramidase
MLDLSLFRELGSAHRFDPAVLRAIVEVEARASGFDGKTGKILIQFEPHWFRKLLTPTVRAQLAQALLAEKNGRLTPTQRALLANWKTTQENKVDTQGPEREAFNAAFTLDKKAAMLATSIGASQIMGFNFAQCGYRSVDEMYDKFRDGREAEHIRAMVRFIVSKPSLAKAVREKNWNQIAFYYNGQNYAAGKYHLKIANAYAKWKPKFG